MTYFYVKIYFFCLFTASEITSTIFYLILHVEFEELQGPRYKTFFMLNSVEHEIFSANKYKNANILIFVSRKNFMLSSALQEKKLKLLVFNFCDKFHLCIQCS